MCGVRGLASACDTTRVLHTQALRLSALTKADGGAQLEMTMLRGLDADKVPTTSAALATNPAYLAIFERCACAPEGNQREALSHARQMPLLPQPLAPPLPVV